MRKKKNLSDFQKVCKTGAAVIFHANGGKNENDLETGYVNHSESKQ